MIIVERTYFRIGSIENTEDGLLKCAKDVQCIECRAFSDDDAVGVTHYINEPGSYKYIKV